MEDNNGVLHGNVESAFTDHEKKQIKGVFNVWSDFIKAPTIGPFQAFSKDSIFYSQELFNLGQTLIQMQANLKEYWTQMNNSYLHAVEQVADRIHNGKQQQHYNNEGSGYSPKEDIEEFRKTVID